MKNLRLFSLYLGLILSVGYSQNITAAAAYNPAQPDAPGSHYPLFGHYYGHGYHFMSHITFTHPLTREQAHFFTPAAVAVVDGPPALPDPTFLLKITGTRGNKVNNIARPELDTLERVPPPWNTLFHRWSRIPNNGSQPVQMGMFDRVGAQGNDLPSERLGGVSVNPHGDQFSPDNAKFSPTGETQFITFGLIGSHNGRTLLTYEVLIDNEKAQRLFEGVVSGPHSLVEIFHLLSSPNFRECFARPGENNPSTENLAAFLVNFQQAFPGIAGGAAFGGAGRALGGAAAAGTVVDPAEAILAATAREAEEAKRAEEERLDFLLATTSIDNDDGAAAAIDPLDAILAQTAREAEEQQLAQVLRESLKSVARTTETGGHGAPAPTISTAERRERAAAAATRRAAEEAERVAREDARRAVEEESVVVVVAPIPTEWPSYKAKIESGRRTLEFFLRKIPAEDHDRFRNFLNTTS